MLLREHRLAAVHRRHRNPQIHSLGDYLIRGVLCRPFVHERVPEIHVLHAFSGRRRPRPFAALQQVKAFYQHQKVLCLLARIRVESDPAVFGRLYRRQLHAASRTAPSPFPMKLLRHLGIDGQRDDPRLGDGKVNMAASARLLSQSQGSDCSRRRVSPGCELRHSSASFNGRLVGAASERNRTALGLDGEFSPRRVRQGAVSAVRSDGADHQMRKLPRKVYFLGFSRGKIFHHDVGASQQISDMSILGRAQHRPLGGIEVTEQRAAVMPPRFCFWNAAGRRPSAHRVAVWPLHLHHIGSAVGQQLRGIRPRNVGREVQNSHAVKSAHRCIPSRCLLWFAALP